MIIYAGTHTKYTKKSHTRYWIINVLHKSNKDLYWERYDISMTSWSHIRIPEVTFVYALNFWDICKMTHRTYGCPWPFSKQENKQDYTVKVSHELHHWSVAAQWNLKLKREKITPTPINLNPPLNFCVGKHLHKAAWK